MKQHIMDNIDRCIYGIGRSIHQYYEQHPVAKEARITKVIFNPPETIIIWDDGTKTVVKCGDNDIYDPEKGMAMAICKKTFGNKGNYCNVFKKWLPKEKEKHKCGNCKYCDANAWESPCFECRSILTSNIFESMDPKNVLYSK